METKVRHEAERRHADHQTAVDRFRVSETPYRRKHKKQGNRQQDGSVHEGGDDFRPLVPVGPADVFFLPRDFPGDVTEQDGYRVAQVVRRVGQKRKAARHEPARHFHNRDQPVQESHSQIF